MDLREIDRLVAEHVMQDTFASTPHYSTDIAAAWEVMERLTRAESTLHMPIFNLRFMAEVRGEYAYPCWLVNYAESSGPGIDLSKVLTESMADTAPLAICKAALKAKGVEL